MNFLCSYRPLVATAPGREAIRRFGLPPFIDGSCRREPDFESSFPSISAICRTTNFAPRLHVGDRVAYITIKGRYAGFSDRHWRLVAILRALERFESHKDAADWYEARGVRTPSNCMLRDSEPEPLERTNGAKPSLREWDLEYHARARACGVFLACESEFRELRSPPAIDEAAMDGVFGRAPGTQNPPSITDTELAGLRAITRVQVRT